MVSTRGFLAPRPLAALLLSLLTGCHVWQPATAGPETLIPAERPTAVRVTLADGVILTVLDPIMRSDSIVPTEAGGVAVAASDIRSFEVRRFSTKRTIVFIVGGIVLAATWTRAAVSGSQGGGPPPDPIIKFAPFSGCLASRVGASC